MYLSLSGFCSGLELKCVSAVSIADGQVEWEAAVNSETTLGYRQLLRKDCSIKGMGTLQMDRVNFTSSLLLLVEKLDFLYFLKSLFLSLLD